MSALPLGRWLKVLSCFPVFAELIVRGPLFRILQDLVRFLHFLESRFGVFLLADIRVIFASQASVGALDIVLRCIAGDSENFVIVLEFHRTDACPTAVAMRVPGSS